MRLSIAEVWADGSHRVRYEQKAGLRLGARLGADGALGPEAVTETARVVSAFAATGAAWNVGTWLAVGTAAVRQATDGAAFLHAVSSQTGVGIRMLDGAEEARLGLLGVLNTIAEPEGYAIDIGGASTELTWFTQRRAAGSLSIPLGAVTAAARFDLQEQASPTAVRALRQAMDAECAAADAWLLPRPTIPLIGIGGTVRALGKLDRKRRSYPLHATHNYVLDGAATSRLAERLAAMPLRERIRVPGLAAERADLIAAGAGILAWAIARTTPSQVIVSGSGLREGLLYSYLLRDQAEPLFPDVLEASVANQERLNGLPPDRAARLGQLASALWPPLCALVGAPGSEARLLPAAARLRDIGTSVSYYDWEQHTFYLLREARLYGLDHRERLLLAAAAAYSGAPRLRDNLRPYVSLLAPNDLRLAVRMGIVAALAGALDRACGGRALPLQITTLPAAVRIATAAPPAHGFATDPLAADCRKWFGRPLGVVSATP